jgi:hypothetical protein
LDPHQVTNSTSISPAAVSSNKNPAWSTLRTDPNQIIPNQINPNGSTTSENLLAFASTRANANASTPFQATAIKSTFDIYWMHARVTYDPKQTGVYTVTTPESVGNACIKLQTTSPGSTYNPAYPNDPSYQDPTFNFDPNFTSNEDNPAWPQYISSYRIAFQSDRGASLQIWGSTMIDIDAPSLLRYNLQTGTIVSTSLNSESAPNTRQFAAGETVRFRVAAVDYESGMQSVFIQIKDPNSAEQAADQTEHRTYFVGLGFIDKTPEVIDPPYEIDYQAINPTTNLFHKPGYLPAEYGGQSLPNWPGWNQYMPGIDDVFAFSGGVHPPDTAANNLSGQGGFWLQLWDDGPVSEGGHEPPGELKGDGLFTGTWTTPANLPSDWVIDVILRDNALNPFEDPTNPNANTNWKIYDNVWGFTTQPWIGNSGILYVNDYDSGQKFFQGANDNNTGVLYDAGGDTPGSFNGGSFYTGVPTESWMTEYAAALIPNEVISGTTVYALSNVLTTLGQNAYTDDLAIEPSGASIFPVTATYDQWRIQCRGPVPTNVLNAYLGHLESQPPNVLNGSTAPNQVYVANRCVVWHSTYAGDLFVGPGTILDSNTQVQLAAFVQAGGRLFLSGQDCAWGLTLGGGVANALLSSTFLVNYAGDYGGVTITPHTADPPIVAPYTSPIDAGGAGGGRGTHPIIMETWYGGLPNYHAYLGPAPPYPNPDNPPGTTTMYLVTPVSGTPVRYYSCPNGISGDELQFLGTPTLDVEDYDATYAETGTVNLVWYTNTKGAPTVSKVVYMSLPMEAINPEYFGTYVLKSDRAEIMHNVGDYLRTGSIVGKVLNLNGATPIKGVFLAAVSQHRLNANGTPYVAATTYSLADGSYSLDGLDAIGTYNVECFKAGFITTHGAAGLFHGGYQGTSYFYLAVAQPGSISGTVTLNNSTTPAPGLIVVATDLVSQATFQAITGALGTYTITNVPASAYSVTLPNAPAGNLNTLGYGSCIPASYPDVVVTSATLTPNINFAVTQKPGSLTGTVTSLSSNPVGAVIAGATVTATDSNNNTYTGVTNAQGVYTIANLVPGTYGVVATASGYLPSNSVSVTIATNAPTTQNFALKQAAPGGIQGLVSTSLGVPINGATVTITNALGTVLQTLTTTAAQTVNGVTFNYDTGLTVPAGAVVSVAASKTGYNIVTPPANPQSVTVAQGLETTGINFYLNPLESFTPSLSLVSAPYEYSGVDGGSAATLLGVPSSDVTSKEFSFITWDPTSAVYINFPTAPADTFHLGRGYFLADTDPSTTLTITTPGTPAPANLNFNINMKPGWNLIGDPFTFSINFLNLFIQAADGTTEGILAAQTGTNPSLGAALWGFANNTYEVSYTLDPWAGYWLRVFDNRPPAQQTTPANIILEVNPAAEQNRSATGIAPDARFAMTNGNSSGEGWKVKMTASAGSVNAPPALVGVTRGALNTYDQFKLEMPPAIGKTNVAISVSHTDWGKQSGLYAVDLRSPSNSTNSWNFTVSSNVPNQPVVLGWPAVADVTSKQDLILTDTDTNTTINLRTASGYTIAGTKTGAARHFTLTASAAKRVSLQIASINAHMIGGSTGTRAASPTAVTIGYTITAAATTQVSILKNGHVVRMVEQGVSREAGDASLVWDLKNDHGVSVPGDVYQLQVEAQDAEGHLARQVTPLIVTR